MSIIRQRVNIYEMPSVDNLSPGTAITMGDLHANVITLMSVLVNKGIVFNITRHQYHEFVHLAQKGGDALSAQDLQHFYQIIEYLEIKKDIMILLVGDDVADRAENPDLFPVELIVKLKKNGVDITVLLSNHGIELLDRSEKRRPFSETRLPFPYTNSAHQLQRLIDRGLVDREEFEHTLDSFYKPCLKVIAYSYGEDKEFFLYSHAPVGLRQIEDIVREFDCVYSGYGIEILAREIDCINDRFQTHLKNRQAHLLYDYERLGHDSGAIDFAIWNRERNNLDRPETLDGYRLRFVHGHDSNNKDKDPVHIINLDGLLGKAPHLNAEEYQILVQEDLHYCEAIEDCHATHNGDKLLLTDGEDALNFEQTSSMTNRLRPPLNLDLVLILVLSLALCALLWYMIKSIYAVLTETVEKESTGLIDDVIIRSNDYRINFDRAKKELCDIEEFIFTKNINHAFLFTKDELQLRLTELEAQGDIPLSRLKELEEDLVYLKKTFISEIVPCRGTNALQKKEKNSLFFNAVVFFCVKKRKPEDKENAGILCPGIR